MKLPRISLWVLLSLLAAAVLSAQPAQQPVKVLVSPDHADWQYHVGEPVQFTVSVFQNGYPVEGEVHYVLNPEKMPPIEEKTVALKAGRVLVEGGTMDTPGFLRLGATIEIDGKTYKGTGTAGFDPRAIQAVTTLPDDFEDYWNAAKAELAEIPVEPTMTRLPERCTDKVDVYHVSMCNFPGDGRSRIYGVLCVPKGDGPFPALLKVPGAGVRPYYGEVGMAERGMITLQIGIHGIPVNMDSYIYDNLRYGALSGYPTFRLDDRDEYYYKRVFLGCVRAVDFIFGLDAFDGENLAVSGGSQGGALSIVTTALDDRIKCLGVFYPAMCDQAGYTAGRAGGWPHTFHWSRAERATTETFLETTRYYDVANFARFVSVPGIYSWGYNDNVCPPTSMYAAYNLIEAPKDLFLALDTAHWAYPEQKNRMNDWLVEQLLEGAQP